VLTQEILEELHENQRPKGKEQFMTKPGLSDRRRKAEERRRRWTAQDVSAREAGKLLPLQSLPPIRSTPLLSTSKSTQSQKKKDSSPDVKPASRKSPKLKRAGAIDPKSWAETLKERQAQEAANPLKTPTSWPE